MSRPTTETLEIMFTALVSSITNKLADPECPASIIKEARELLKDNNMEVTDKGIKTLQAIDNLLPFMPNSVGDSN